VTTKVEAHIDDYEGKSLLELTKKELKEYADKLEKEMREAAKALEFERAAVLRDRLLEVRAKL
jgi:excinuclease ABC subunit B